MSILIENISKNFGRLSQINLEIPTGSLVALIGPSGSGKSTLLRTLAGFEKPDSGRIWFQGRNSTFLPIHQREIGFVFQDYALFPKYTVYENIAFGLKIKKKSNKAEDGRVPLLEHSPGPAPEGLVLHKASPRSRQNISGILHPHFIRAQVDELLHLTQLENFATFYPHELSGGQKQRVGFARALAIEPKILLLDEPFGALDVQVRKSLRVWLSNLHEKLPLTSILVTHDLEEAMEIADEIVILKQGRIEQVGTAEEIYEYPGTDFVQNFINC
uniref:Putative sulfate/thiosulfate import ATP-binding protein CysA n=1 Tax=Caulerpa racemosa TaxID=76317 RepID=A0A1I9LK53_CAURA|nr:putative sulfate/thiosulfate import ATP-binding protein CysA [Caulerpa racemosa]ANJ70714.1 putative sulfate/thiosulfate import ATP-binding protein CysA [Caulerpa racemosa]